MRTCEGIYASEIRERVETKRNPDCRICKNKKVLSCDGSTLVEMPVDDDDDDIIVAAAVMMIMTTMMIYTT